MATLVEVARVADIAPHCALTVQVDEFAIALFNIDGRILAVDAACIRCASLLASGRHEGHDVICAGCGWRYDLTTGRLPAIPKLRIDTFEVEFIGSRVLIRKPGA